MAEKLGPGERDLLRALQEGGPSPPAALAGTGSLQEEVQVMNAASWLRAKGLVKIRERIARTYTLQDPAWASRDLPERKALSVLLEAPELSTEELQRRGGLRDEEMPIVLGWLRRKGWADIRREGDATLVTLREEGRTAAEVPGPDELLIQRLAGGRLREEDVDPQVLAMLKQRQEIVDERRRVERELRLTEKAGPVLKALEKSVQLSEDAQVDSQVTPELLQSGAWEERAFRKYDVGAYAPAHGGAKLHPMTQYIEKIRRLFLEMGFTEIHGNYVGSAFWHFDALFQPQDHPARDMLDTFYVREAPRYPLPADDVVRRVARVHEDGGETGSTGWGYAWQRAEAERPIMRPHTTGETIRYLADHPDPPQRAFSVGKVFRTDSPDATHLPGEFHQIEGVVMEEGANLAMLIGVIQEFYRRMGFEEVRFRPGYFPYTEPSMEPEGYLKGQWIELGGSGIFRPEVTAPLGITTPVLAWGLGLERFVMVLEGLPDIRMLVENDLEWLRGSRAVW